MQTLFRLFTYISAIFGLLPFLKPKDRSTKTLLWLPKALAGSLSPIYGIICGVGALVGLVRKDWKLASAGLIGVSLAAKFIEDIPRSEAQFKDAFGIDWDEQIPDWIVPQLAPVRFSIPAKASGEYQHQQNIAIGQKPQGSDVLLADLWLPKSGSHRSGLGLIYAHGSGWRVSDKDMQTRPFFKRLVTQGHVILDIAYSLWPEADLPTMVMEINQAILWMKDNAKPYGINPKKIVLMGGSAGAHLTLLAAYAPDEPAFRAPGMDGDTTICGVVSFYPPVDLLALQTPFEAYEEQTSPALLEKAADGMIQAIFKLGSPSEADDPKKHSDMISEMLGGTSEQIPDTYQLLSPIYHAGPHCPPTLLLQGADDVFELAPGVQELQAKLREENVPVVWIEFPHTEHAFDLFAPNISPLASASTYDVERFLALLI